MLEKHDVSTPGVMSPHFMFAPTPADITRKIGPIPGIITFFGGPGGGDITHFFQNKSDVPQVAREGGGAGQI